MVRTHDYDYDYPFVCYLPLAVPDDNFDDAWIQINFTDVRTITGIRTKGRNQGGVQTMLTFQLYYWQDNVLKPVLDDGGATKVSQDNIREKVRHA